MKPARVLNRQKKHSSVCEREQRQLCKSHVTRVTVQAHLYRQTVGEQAQKPAKRDRRQLNAVLLEVRCNLGHDAGDEVLQHLLVGT